MKWLMLAAMLSGCAAVTGDAGCTRYGEERRNMPRPIPDDALGAWVAVLDSAMTATCR